MQLRNIVYTTSAVLAAASLATLAAWWSVSAVENRSAAAVKSQFLNSGITWASVRADGLLIHLAGTAPNEAARFRAANLVGSVVQASRLRDGLEVTAIRAIEAPRFSVEMLRNDDGISLIGLLPGKAREAALAESVAAFANGVAVSDMLETADYPAPESWEKALQFGLYALKLLPRSKISVDADRVTITAISGSAEEKRRLESELARNLPAGLRSKIDISAPRPVLTPFTLRFVLDAEGARFDACSADTTKARDRVLTAGNLAGVAAKTACTVGLGVPTPRWAEAAEMTIEALSKMGGGTVTFSDADITLLGAETTTQAQFDRVIGDLQAQLPPVFSLQASLPPKADTVAKGPAEFTAELAEDGQAQLRGRLTDEVTRDAVDSFARAQFGADRVYTGTRHDPDLPQGWPVRVLAGLQALGQLHHGSLLVRADVVEISGVTGQADGRARISQILSDKLGHGKTFRINVRYDEKYDPTAALPTPQDCAAMMNAAMSQHKITFAPGSAEIEGQSQATIDRLAEILQGCPPLEMEIGGHTDSQGSDSGNRALSQARAEAVLTTLQGRRLQVAGFIAKGYGEDNPIAGNDSEAGREANRRIEFALLSAPEAAAAPSPLDLVRAAEVAQEAERAEAEAATDAAAGGQTGGQATDAQETELAAVSGDAGSGDAGSGDTGSGDEAFDSAGDEMPADAPAADNQAGSPPDSAADAPNAQVAALDEQTDLGEVRSIQIDEGTSFLFQPTDEKWPRPQRRP